MHFECNPDESAGMAEFFNAESTLKLIDETIAPPAKPQPGERCPTCDRRVNKPRKPSSPGTKRVSGGNLPPERAVAVDDALDALQAFIGADAASYPRGSVIEALVLLGGQHREELREWFVAR